MTLFRRPSFRAVNRPDGFTLIELLTVVAIIAILAALLFPIVGNMKRAGLASKCAGQLRQLGMGSINYSAEWDGELMPSGAETGSTYAWSEKIKPYIEGRYSKDWVESQKMNKVVFCPEFYSQDPKGKKILPEKRYEFNWNTGYTINDRPNYGGTPDLMNRKNFKANGQPADGTTSYRLMEVTYKSIRPQLVDGYEWQSGTVSLTNTNIDFNRHGKNKCNVLFFDGHVETCAPQEIVDGWMKPESIAKVKE